MQRLHIKTKKRYYTTKLWIIWQKDS